LNIFLATAMTDIPSNRKSKHIKNINILIDKLNATSDMDVYSGLTHPANINRKEFDLKENSKLYKWYEKLIKKTDIFVADITYSSVGVGIELQIASALSKPIYLIVDTSFRKKENISRMLLGITGIEELIEYTDIQSLNEDLRDKFRNK